MKNCVFTIVAKNYIPLAQALHWSLKKNNDTPIEFTIFVADELDQGFDYSYTGCNVVPVSEIGIESINDWAFKYNVTEFCTAVKPSCIKYLFNHQNANNVIYFDPDIFVFSSLDGIFNDLETHSIIVTPHYNTLQVDYTGDQKETGTLFVGIYNFGFVAFKKTYENFNILNWWENRLSTMCYADIQDALHTDQKWADFFPVYAGNNLLISKSIGCNLAPWNLFEREVLSEEQGFIVRNRITDKREPLVFVHFAGFDPNNLNLIHKDFWAMTIDKYPDYKLIRDIYIEVTNQFNFSKLKGSSYSYSTFSDGVYIHDHYRRFYRALKESGKVINDPFNAQGWFYNKLKREGILSKNRPQKLNSKNVAGFDSKVNKIQRILRFFFKIIGSEKYFLLMKFLNRYSRAENQIFLLGEDVKKVY